MLEPKRIRGLHVYTGEGFDYGVVTSDMLNELKSRRINTFVIHLGHQNHVRFDQYNSFGTPTSIVNRSISDLDDFLREWNRSELAESEMYVGLPLLHDNIATINDADSFYSHYVDFMREVKDTIIDRLGQDYWDQDFAGFYFRTEAVYPIQEKISSTNPTSNPMVKLMNDLSYRIRNTYERQFLWCPYYGHGSNMDNIIHNLGVVANRTNIFDAICIQPAYYYAGSAYRNNLDLVFESANSNEVVDADGDPVSGGRRSSATAAIGVNMEADNNFNTTKATQFNAYVDTFSPLIGEAPIVFYANATENLVNNEELLDAIEDFYRS